MEKYKPAWLLASERSGSNLIRAMLDSHSAVYSPMPIHLTAFQLDIWRYGDLDFLPNWKLIVRHCVAWLDAWHGSLGFKITEEDILDNVAPGNYANIYRYLYTRGIESNEKTRIFIKENHTWRFIPFILGNFPGAKFVFQVRDPRDFILSCKNNIKPDGLMHYHSVERALDVWEEDQRASLRLLGALGPSKVLFQRYEDLIERPEEILRRLCVFLDIDFEHKMLEFYKAPANQEQAKRSMSWTNLGQPLIHNNKNKWKNHLSDEEIHRIEQRIGDLIVTFNYELSETYKQGSTIDREDSLFNILNGKVSAEKWKRITDSINQDLSDVSRKIVTS